MMNAEPRPLPAPPLPFLAPRRSMAWALSLAGHAVALGLGLWLVERGVTAPRPEPERMVYIEPAPPPPPPLGAPVDAPSAPVVPQPVIERLKEIPKPRRLVAPHKSKRVIPPSPVPAAAPRGEPEGSVGGVIGGVISGEVGGKVGGVVGGHGDAPIPTDQVEHPAVTIARVLPVYPRAARARGLEGRVVLRAIVGRDGHVEEAITVVKSAAMFDAVAIAALRQWRFEPGRDRDGKPVRVLIDVPIRFQLR
jgi:protein TonB